jgi:hypothetical protein
MPAEFDPSEVRLFYVALTRGREEVEASPATLALFDGSIIMTAPPTLEPVTPPLPSPAVVPAQPPGNGVGAHRPNQGNESIVPRHRVSADAAFRGLAKALIAFTRARERGEAVSDVRIDPVIAASLVESWIKYQKAGGELTLDQIMQLGPQSRESTLGAR